MYTWTVLERRQAGFFTCMVMGVVMMMAGGDDNGEQVGS